MAIQAGRSRLQIRDTRGRSNNDVSWESESQDGLTTRAADRAIECFFEVWAAFGAFWLAFGVTASAARRLNSHPLGGYCAKEFAVIDLVKRRRTDGMLFVWLLLAGLLGSLIGVPYTIAVLMDPAAGGPVDPQAVWLLALAEAVFFLAPASAVGVWLGEKVGLGPRLLREFITKVPEGWQQARSSLQASLVVGFTLGVFGFVQYLIPEGALGPGLDNPTTFEYFLRSLSAALTEEIFFRLGLLTFFVWVIRSIAKKPALHVLSLWVGNVLAALVFAGGHLPHMLTFGTPGWSLLIPIVLVSSFGGIIMGWLYIRYGLISAMVAHFIVDLVVYVIPRLLAIIA